MYPGPPNKSGSQDIAVKFIFKRLYHKLEKHKMITNNKRNKKIIVEEKQEDNCRGETRR